MEKILKNNTNLRRFDVKSAFLKSGLQNLCLFLRWLLEKKTFSANNQCWSSDFISSALIIGADGQRSSALIKSNHVVFNAILPVWLKIDHFDNWSPVQTPARVRVMVRVRVKTRDDPKNFRELSPESGVSPFTSRKHRKRPDRIFLHFLLIKERWIFSPGWFLRGGVFSIY